MNEPIILGHDLILFLRISEDEAWSRYQAAKDNKEYLLGFYQGILATREGIELGCNMDRWQQVDKEGKDAKQNHPDTQSGPA